MKTNRKMSSSERQHLIISTLKAADYPVTASQFAETANVSRQVIVQDVSILKAKNEPVIATSQGYLYLKNKEKDTKQMKTIAVKHRPNQTLKELYTIVDHGVTVMDVRVEHPVYGDLTANIRVGSRKEVDEFYQKLTQPDASHLSSLTDGVHLHTLEADSMEKIEAACSDLEKLGILV